MVQQMEDVTCNEQGKDNLKIHYAEQVSSSRIASDLYPDQGFL
jgi:hypothetical protein